MESDKKRLFLVDPLATIATKKAPLGITVIRFPMYRSDR